MNERISADQRCTGSSIEGTIPKQLGEYWIIPDDYDPETGCIDYGGYEQRLNQDKGFLCTIRVVVLELSDGRCLEQTETRSFAPPLARGWSVFSHDHNETIWRRPHLAPGAL